MRRTLKPCFLRACIATLEPPRTLSSALSWQYVAGAGAHSSRSVGSAVTPSLSTATRDNVAAATAVEIPRCLCSQARSSWPQRLTELQASCSSTAATLHTCSFGDAALGSPRLAQAREVPQRDRQLLSTDVWQKLGRRTYSLHQTALESAPNAAAAAAAPTSDAAPSASAAASPPAVREPEPRVSQKPLTPGRALLGILKQAHPQRFTSKELYTTASQDHGDW